MKWTALALIGALSLPAQAWAEDEVREYIDVTPGGTLEIRLAAGSVEIDTHSEDTVAIEASGSAACRIEGDSENTSIVCGPRGFISLGRPSTRLRVLVPERYSLVVRTRSGSIEIGQLEGEVEAVTINGSISLEGARGWVSLRSVAGSVRAEDIDGDLEVRAIGGSVNVFDVTGRVEAHATGGRILLDEVGGPVEARAVGGSVDVRFTHDPSGTIEADGGGIRIELPEEARLTLDADAVGGNVRVETELRIQRSDRRRGTERVQGEINGGGPELKLRARGGGILIVGR
jgi:DUF4097 and DUF4098 domain-containing protein YvlB